MRTANGNGELGTRHVAIGEVSIAYRVFGETAPGEPWVLIRGLGTQMIEWAPALIEGLIERGSPVAVFDNRDSGLSSGFEDSGTEAAAYPLVDMADDVVGLLDHLGWERAHILGASMGGMIAQLVAARTPERVCSLVSVMSSSGRPGLAAATPEAARVLTAAPPAGSSVEDKIELVLAGRRVLGGRGFPVSDDERRAQVRVAVERAWRPDGVVRQLRAVMACGSRLDDLSRIRVPALVIHGDDDSLLPLEHGADTAAAIPGARLEVIAGMGHEMPASLVPHLLASIDRFRAV